MLESTKRTQRHAHTSSNGRVSLKQLSHTSFTARSAASWLGQAGFDSTEIIARRRTHALMRKTALMIRKQAMGAFDEKRNKQTL